MLTRYRRHSGNCPVHTLKLPLWIYWNTETTHVPRQSTGTNIIAVAKAQKQTLLNGGQNQKVHGPQLDDCFERFCASRKEELGGKTAAAHRFQLDRSRPYCATRGVHFMRELSVDLLEDFKVARRMAQWALAVLAVLAGSVAFAQSETLIREYFRQGSDAKRIPEVILLVRNAPESRILGEPAATIGKAGADYDALKSAWEEQIAKPTVTAAVLANAANFFRPLEPERCIALLQRARAIDPKNAMWTMMLGEIYAFQMTGITSLNQNGFPIAATAPRAEQPLPTDDPELLGAIAAGLMGRGAIAAAMTGRQAETAALAERALRRARQLEPRNPKWANALGQFYANHSDAKKAMEQFDAAGPDFASALPPSRYARVAVETGQLDKAQAAAERCLAQQSTDTAIHECNLILGRVALRRGDTESAGQYLLKAALVRGTGVLSSFGPNMMLAKELLEKGQADVVLQYFEACVKFWSYDRGQLDRWTQQVRAGKIPTFGANLVY